MKKQYHVINSDNKIIAKCKKESKALNISNNVDCETKICMVLIK